jgi:hypothetical protein
MSSRSHHAIVTACLLASAAQMIGRKPLCSERTASGSTGRKIAGGINARRQAPRSANDISGRARSIALQQEMLKDAAHARRRAAANSVQGGWRRHNSPGKRSGPSLPYCSRRPCFGFLAQSDGRWAIPPAAEAPALTGLLRPQCRLVFRLWSFTLDSLRAFVLFAPRSSFVVAPLRFARATGFALDRCQLLRHGSGRKALLKPAALNACRFGARGPLFSPCRDRPLHRLRLRSPSWMLRKRARSAHILPLGRQ